jgi:hypothetical protein
MGGWALRAKTAGGRAYDAPNEALLSRLLGELGPGNQFLVVDRLDAPGDEHYMQVYREIDGSYVVEYRDGVATRHFETVTANLGTAFTLLIGWAANSPGWRDAARWRQWPVP